MRGPLSRSVVLILAALLCSSSVTSISCGTILLLLLPKQCCPGHHILFRCSFWLLAQVWHRFLISSAVGEFPGLLRSAGCVPRTLGRKLLQTCAHVTRVTCTWTVSYEASGRAFLSMLPMLLRVGRGVSHDFFLISHLLVAPPTFSTSPTSDLKSQQKTRGASGFHAEWAEVSQLPTL